ncbi:MAG: elongation factor G [Candidatus Omnitrophica bacterium]|nr:elongation factor G [Candidatus Omnitrophota bacterium]
MENYSENTIRNVVLVSHTGAGKTSLADSMLFNCRQVSRLGRVDEGNSISDFDPIEINHKISINASIMHCIKGSTKINIIDTPGYADFIMELRNCVPAADVAIVVISATDGIEVGTQRGWGVLDEAKLPRAIFISKLDKENADFYSIVDAIKKEFGAQCAPLFLPVGKESSFKGVANLLTKTGWEGLNEDEKEKAEKFRESFIETVAMADDTLLEKYLNGEELTQEEICRVFKIAFKDNTVIPVFCGNALDSIGVKELIEKIVNFFPAPSAAGKIEGVDPQTKEKKELITKIDQPFAGYVFKTISDPYVGQLSVFRVVSGSLISNTEFINVTTNASERFGQLYVLQGKEQLPVECVSAGDIGAVAKLKNTHTGDSMTSAKNKVLFNISCSMEPSISYSLKPKTRQDEEKISQALAKMTTEDQGLRVSRDSQTKELILSGMGDMHLEIAIERLKSRYHVDVDVGTPKVPYKETIKKTVKVHHKYKKQSGGRGQYGDVWLEISPLPRGGDFEFVDRVVGGSVPRQYIPSVEKGVRKKMIDGIIAGYPLVDIQVALYDGSYHEVDSSDMAFQIAAGMALKQGILDANPVLLEPVMNVEVVIGPEYMGAINGDLSSRRGRVQGMEQAGKYEMIKAQVPLSEMLRYATDLRSMTQGRGSYSMSFSHYEEVPHKQAEKIISQSKAEEKEEVH